MTDRIVRAIFIDDADIPSIIWNSLSRTDRRKEQVPTAGDLRYLSIIHSDREGTRHCVHRQIGYLISDSGYTDRERGEGYIIGRAAVKAEVGNIN